MTKPKKTAVMKGAGKPAPSEAMQGYLAGAKARVKALPIRPEPVVEFATGGAVKVDAPHSDDDGQAYAVMDALATQSNAFVGKQLRHMLNAYDASQQPSGEDLGSALAIIGAVQPQNELEAALAVQMALTHNLAASITARAQRCETFKGMTEYGNLATKAARTFTAQLEALTKLRSGGKQIVEHRHIYVDNRGGQAIVADHVTIGGPGHGRQIEDQSHALGAPLPSPHASGHPVPGAEGAGRETVPHARS